MTNELSWPTIIESLLARRDLSITEATWSMERVMLGEATPAQLAAFLVALRSKGETVDEIVGFRDAVLEDAYAEALAMTWPPAVPTQVRETLRAWGSAAAGLAAG